MYYLCCHEIPFNFDLYSDLQLTKDTTWRRFRFIEPILAKAKLPQDTKLKQPAPGITLAHPGLSMQVIYCTL